MPAHADFICEKCHDAGKMPKPVELPVGAKKCPFCGKAKYLSRIWSGYSQMIRTDKGRSALAAHEMLGPGGYDQQMNVRREGRPRSTRPFAGAQLVPVGQVGSAIAEATQGKIPNYSIGTMGAGKPSGIPITATNAGEGVGPVVRMPPALVRDAGKEYSLNR